MFGRLENDTLRVLLWKPFLIAAGRKVKLSSAGCFSSPSGSIHGYQTPTPTVAGGGCEWVSCPDSLCGPEEMDAYPLPPRTGTDTLSVGVLKTQQFVAWFVLFVPRGTDSSLLTLWMFLSTDVAL